MIKKIRILFIIASVIPFLNGCGGGPWGGIQEERGYGGLTWSPDGKYIAVEMATRLLRYGSTMGGFYSSYKDEDVKTARSYLIKVNAVTKDIDIITQEAMPDYYGSAIASPLWRGDRLFYLDSGRLKVVAGNDKNNIRTILDNIYLIRDYKVSRSGKYIVYWSSTYSSDTIWNIIDLDGTGNRQLTTERGITSEGSVALLGWSKTEDFLYFEASSQYYKVDIDGNIVNVSGNYPDYDGNYDDDRISPDSTKIAYGKWVSSLNSAQLFLTAYVSGEDPVGGENISEKISDKLLGLVE